MFTGVFTLFCSLMSSSLAFWCSQRCYGCVHWSVQVSVYRYVQIIVFTGVFRSLCSWVCSGHCFHRRVQVIVFTCVFRSLCSLVCSGHLFMGVFRSLCSLVCKWGYEVQGAEHHGWSDDFLKHIGLQELTENNHSRIGE